MINSMEGELTCSICLELYTTPLMLPCTHNFCEQCIQGLVRHGGGARTFACPTCRREVVQDRSFLSSLPVNRSLNQVVKAFIKEKESNTFAASMCFLHNEPRNLFCTTCKTDMCQKCLQKDESHLRFGHHVAAVEELITEEKRKLNPVVEEAKRLQGDIHEKQRQIKAEEESIKEEVKRKTETMRSNCDIMIALLNMKKQELDSSLQMALSEDLAPLHQFASELRKKEQQLDIMLKENKLVRSTGTSQNKLRGMQLLFAKLSSFVAFCDTGVVSKVTPRHQGVDFSDVDHAIKALSWNGSGSDLMQEKTINAQHTIYTGKKTPSAHGKKANFKLKDIVKDMQNCHLSKGSKSRNSLDSNYFARFSFSSEDIPAEVGFKKSDKESSKPRRKERSLALNTVPPTLTSFWSNQSKLTSVPDGTSLFPSGNDSAGASASNSIMTRSNQESLAQEAKLISSRLFDRPLDAMDSVRGGEKQGVGATNPAGNRSAGFAGAAPRAFSPHSCSELEMSSGSSLVAQRGSASSVTLSNTDSDSERPYASVTPINEGWSEVNQRVGFNAVPVTSNVEEEQLLQSAAGVFTLENANNQNTRSHSALVENSGHSGDQNVTSGHNVTVDQGTSTGAALPDPDRSTLNPDRARGDSIQGVSNPDGAFSDLGQAASNSDQALSNPSGAAAGNTSLFGTGEFRFALSPAVAFKSSGRVHRKAARRLRHK